MVNIEKLLINFEGLRHPSENIIERLERARLLIPLGAGIYGYSTYYQQSLDKLTAYISTRLNQQGFSKIGVPPISPIRMWEESERFQKLSPFLFQDDGQIISGTYEEPLLKIVQSLQFYDKHLPIKIYTKGTVLRKIRPKTKALKIKHFDLFDILTFTDSETDSKKEIKDLVIGILDYVLNESIVIDSPGRTDILVEDERGDFPFYYSKDSNTYLLNNESVKHSERVLETKKGFHIGEIYDFNLEFPKLQKIFYDQGIEKECSIVGAALGVEMLLNLLYGKIFTGRIHFPIKIAPFKKIIIPRGQHPSNIKRAYDKYDPKVTLLDIRKIEVRKKRQDARLLGIPEIELIE